MRSLLGGRDACVVMPTGGGNSLCYQLPGAMLPGQTVIVVSPLIALMQDQVAQLGQMGIPSALLNSSLAAGEQAQVIREARAGEYRLLYLSPERLARADTLDWLQGMPVSFFATEAAFRSILLLFNLLGEFPRTCHFTGYRQPATLRAQVFLCGALLGRAGRRLVLYLSTSWGGLQQRIPLPEDVLIYRAPTSPKFNPQTAT